MKVGLIVTGLVLGWFALFVLGLYSYVVGHSSMTNPMPRLPWAMLAWLVITGTVITVAIYRAVTKDD